MKKRSCRMNDYEKACHEKAVKIRKMTDVQICNYLDDIADSGRKGNQVQMFLDRLNILGIGLTTVDKLKKYARDGGYLD